MQDQIENVLALSALKVKLEEAAVGMTAIRRLIQRAGIVDDDVFEALQVVDKAIRLKSYDVRETYYNSVTALGQPAPETLFEYEVYVNATDVALHRFRARDMDAAKVRAALLGYDPRMTTIRSVNHFSVQQGRPE